ncbi:MAG: 50S ribosomal protein L11 methyltransferase [Ignavibacteriaceae bacterium]|nr:50S ribosomal protein L11 methyltransferase [Ignavibacteriaceae bacterium]
MTQYKEITLTASPFDPEIIAGIVWKYNPQGVEETENGLKIFAGIEDELTLEILHTEFEALKSNNLISDFELTEIIRDTKNWNKEWEDNREIIKVGKRFVIRPSFKDYTPESGEIALTIDPKMSFGTGEHATTRLVMEMLEEIVKGGERVLDVGTGTGILAIAAVKLGAASAVGVDNDDWCLENGIENITQNGVADTVKILTGELKDIPAEKFDIVLANIQKDVLIQLAGEFGAYIKPDGFLVLSGILTGDEEDIINKYSSLGYSLHKTIYMDEWICIAMKN